MVIDKIDSLLNDSEINFLADLFLAHYGFDRGSLGYRYFRNAVILASRGLMKTSEAYPLLARCADTDVQTFLAVLTDAVRALPSPIHQVFNTVYSPSPDAPTVSRITMKNTRDVGYIISFLGTAFLYLVLTDYPKYDFISLIPSGAPEA